ncbi:PAS domain S-box protein [Inhella sp.]|uniref:PAS domain S-box protein n=1 Tax=Inhella sp. TaxID=1921806 RepID=UPI0035AE1581
MSRRAPALWPPLLALIGLGAGGGLGLWLWPHWSDLELFGLRGAQALAAVAQGLLGLLVLAAACLLWLWGRAWQRQLGAAELALREEQEARRALVVEHELLGQVELIESGRRELRDAQWRQREGQWLAVQGLVAMSVTDLQGRILEVNERLCELSGYRRDELIGQPHRLLSSGLHPRSFWDFFWQELRAGRVWRGVLCNRGKGGELFWLEARVMPQRDAAGVIERWVLVGCEVSTLVQREREQAEAQQRLSAIVEGMQAGAWDWHYQTDTLRVNARFLSLLGLEADTSMGWAVFRDHVHADDQERLATALRRHLSGQAPMFELELRMQGVAGLWPWFQLRGTVVQRTPTGDPLWLAGVLIHIDERRQAEESAHVQRLISERTQRLARVGGFELRLRDRQFTWTDEAFRLHDLSPGTQPSFEQALAYVHPDDRERFRQAIEASASEARSWGMEMRLRSALGREVWVRAVGEAECDESGPLRVVGALQDIAEQRALEEGMRQQQQVLRSVVDHLPLGVSVFGPDMKLLARSEALAPLLDLPPDLLVEGQVTYEELVRFNAARGEYGDGPLAERALERLVDLARDPVAHHFERTRPNGITLEVRGAPMPWGGLVSTYIDISERKRAEETMRAQERFLRLVANAVPGRIAYWSRSERCVFANRAFAEWLHTTPERSVGATAEELLGADAAASQRLRLAPALVQGRAMHFEQDDGQGGTLLVHAEPDIDADQEVRGVVVMALDISELKAVQRQTEQLNALLSVERDRANAANVAKSQFLATMSHEIRTPLNAILGMLRLLRRTPLIGQQLDYLNKTQGAAKSLLTLLNDILDFSKVEAGKLQLELRPFSSDELLRALGVIMAANADSKPIELVFDLDPALPPWLVGDALRLQQVLINLTGNAIKFTAEGEVCLQLRLLGMEAERAHIGFAVRDTGIGIAPDKLLQVFEGFSQAEASTSRRYGGTGLGLAISQRLVRAMGGELHVSSEPGQGSTFSFSLELPVAPAVEPAELPLSHQEPGALLLIEPHSESRRALAVLLESIGQPVLAVGSGAEARQALRGNPTVARAWVAAQLPDEDGWDCAQALCAEQAAHGRPMHWWMCGAAILRERWSGHAAGRGLVEPVGFVVKPVCGSQVREALAGLGAEAAPSQAGVVTQALAGMRLLVVEDNPNNQQVAQELLQLEGATVLLADDGEQALALLREQSFDAVLMDMQMPVMDGLSATRAIRGSLGLTDLPIIAMTANALPADREACLAAGMDDHVGKPFEMEPLVRLLQKRVRSRSDRHHTSAAGSQASVARPGHARVLVPPQWQQRAASQGLDLQAGLDRFLGRTALYLRTATSFAAQARELPAQLRSQMAHSPPDCHAAEHALHSFKGLAATLAMEKLAHWGRAGEERARAGQVIEPAWIDSFETQLADGLELLLSMARGLHEPATAPVEPAPVASGLGVDPLGQLAQLLNDESSEVLTLLASQRGALEAWLGDDLERMEEALASLDFATARRVLAERRSVLA